MGHLIQKFFFGLGGLFRWLFFLFLNLVFSKNYDSNIEYYMLENKVIDKSGMDTNQKNFIVGILIFILIIIILNKVA